MPEARMHKRGRDETIRLRFSKRWHKQKSRADVLEEKLRYGDQNTDADKGQRH
jgi:hypothetical protein